MESVQSKFTLANGVKIPCVGYGTWKIKAEEGKGPIAYALQVGYRHIDTAAFYQNEELVGAAIRESNIPRSEIFVTSKVWPDDFGREATKAAFARTLKRLGFDYLDLYLLHWPEPSAKRNREAWDALVELYEAKKIRAIGVSNFMPEHFAALAGSKVQPMVNQIEYHPGFAWKEAMAYCAKNNILVEAWRPLGQGHLLDDPLLSKIAAKYKKTVAQVCLKYCLQQNTLPLPKSVTPQRIVENTQLFDFALTPEEISAIAKMPQAGWSGEVPDALAD